MPFRAFATSTSWLSVTPEPERLLPGAVATLLTGGRPPAAAIEAERDRLERLIRRARLRPWLAYLTRALALAQERRATADPDVVRARALTLELIADHHNLLLGLPSRAAAHTAAERELLRPADHERSAR